MKWTFELKAELTAAWTAGLTGEEIARQMGLASRSAALAQARRMGLVRHTPLRRGRTRTGFAKINSPSHLRRIPTAAPGGGLILRVDHPALHEARTVFPKSVRSHDAMLRILKSGEHQRKVGKRVDKGIWRGLPIYCLTLEERATCPTSCKLWRSCYGNNMHLAQRVKHGHRFERALDVELDALAVKHPRGFVVRLHILGDFYSVGYVDLWARALERIPGLRVFGYTAREPRKAIGKRLHRLATEQWDRFAMRFSGIEGELGATTFNHDEKPTGIACPAQTGKTDCCGTCGLCWTTKREISFEEHGTERRLVAQRGNAATMHKVRWAERLAALQRPFVTLSEFS